MFPKIYSLNMNLLMIVETLVELFIIIWLDPIAVRFDANIY